MANKFGAGPFFVNENIELVWGEHRGEPTDFVHSSAYGQWGSVMVALFRQENDTQNSPYRDMFAADQHGLHHTAVVVDDMARACVDFEANAMPVITRCALREVGAIDFAFADARPQLGHMIEFYPESAGLRAFYEMVRAASIDWDGKDPVRLLSRSRP